MDFYKAAKLPGGKVTAAWADFVYRRAVTSENQIAIVKPGGVLLGIIAESMIGPFAVSDELAWWVDPAHRGGSMAMLDMYEAWAQRMGAEIIGLTSLALMPEVERLYERRGYVRLESHWVRAVKIEWRSLQP